MFKFNESTSKNLGLTTGTLALLFYLVNISLNDRGTETLSYLAFEIPLQLHTKLGAPISILCFIHRVMLCLFSFSLFCWMKNKKNPFHFISKSYFASQSLIACLLFFFDLGDLDLLETLIIGLVSILEGLTLLFIVLLTKKVAYSIVYKLSLCCFSTYLTSLLLLPLAFEHCYTAVEVLSKVTSGILLVIMLLILFFEGRKNDDGVY